MRIRSLWAQGYRSLRDVRLDDLGAFNVLYGQNGSGKSNLLLGLQALMDLAILRATYDVHSDQFDGNAGSEAVKQRLVRRDDIWARDARNSFTLGASLEADPELSTDSIGHEGLTLAVEMRWAHGAGYAPRLRFAELRTGQFDLLNDAETGGSNIRTTANGVAYNASTKGDHVRDFLRQAIPKHGFGLVDAQRFVGPESPTSEAIVRHLRTGRLANAIFNAKIHPDSQVRRRLRVFERLVAGPPLSRPPFDPVQRPEGDREIEIRERLPEPNPDQLDIPLQQAGLGIAQIYTTLAKAVLLGTRSVGIEEPEAHLHAPTTGRHLRQLLARLVGEGHIDQLFIATHSNLFDLDPGGYLDVSLDGDGATLVERRALSDIDARHLYEPGPAKHALISMLTYLPSDTTVYRRPDGSPIGASEMLELLQSDDDLAVDFLRDVHGAAVRSVRVGAAQEPK